MNTMATTVVILLRKVAAPVLPKTVWELPPKAAPTEAPLPVCNRTTKTRVTLARRWIIRVTVVMLFIFSNYAAWMMPKKLSALREAPPTRAPSTSG